MTTLTSEIAQTYERDGYFFPVEILSEAEAAELRADFEAGEAELADRPGELALLRSSPAHLLPSFAALVRHPLLIDAVGQILGPDLLVWGSGFFIKEPQTPDYVSWHQDLTYWGLDQQQEVTAWVALSPATIESGCMRFVAGSHKQPIVPHFDTHAEQNLLTRGQEIEVEVDEADATDVVLRPGQVSLHHGHLFHASNPNGSDDRRIGVALRYITPSMSQRSGIKPLVAHVSGTDEYGHFTHAPVPQGRLLEADFERCRNSGKLMREVLFEGAEQG